MGLWRVLVILSPSQAKVPIKRHRVTCARPPNMSLYLSPCFSGPRVQPDVHAGLTCSEVRRLPAACHLTCENDVYYSYLWWHH